MSQASIASQFYKEHPFYSSLVADTRQLGTLPVDFVRMDQPPFEESDPPSGFLCFSIDMAPGYCHYEVDYGAGLKAFKATPKDFGYVNPTEASTLYRTDAVANMLFISAPIERIATALHLEDLKVREAVRPLYDQMIDNPWFRSHGVRMWRLAQQEGPFASLAIEHGFLALIAGLMAEADPASIALRKIDGDCIGTEDARIARVGDYIETNLDRNLTLDELASISNLSTYHFCKVFKAVTGKTPRAYVMQRRLARARRLLAETPAPITEIAIGCGFASSQHLASAFRRAFGTTPSHFRAEV